MHLLPKTLGPLADLTGESHAKFTATAGVRLQLALDNSFIAEATNGRYALRVSGPCESADDYPSIPLLASAPNGKLESIVMAGDWKKAFADASKLRCRKPFVRDNLAVVIGENETSFAATDLDKIAFHQPKNVAGRFVNIAQVIPQASKAMASFDIDPGLMAKLLGVMDKIGSDEERRVTVELHGSRQAGTTMLALRGRRANGLTMEAAMVPLGNGKPNKPVEIEESSEAVVIEQQLSRIAHLRERVAELEAERDALKAQLESPWKPQDEALSRRERLAVRS